MEKNVRHLQPLPSVTPAEASAAAPMIGGALLNVIIFHALHFGEEHKHASASKVLEIARDSVEVFAFQGGTTEEKGNIKKLVLAMLDNLDVQVHDEISKRVSAKR